MRKKRDKERVTNMADIQPVFTMEAVVQRIFEMRGQRVMLDADLPLCTGWPLVI